MDSRFLRRVKLRNFRSIAACDVALEPLTFLVGPNGSGKSNFIDALRLTADALRSSLDHALRDRGGIQEVRRRSSGHPTNFAVRLDFAMPQTNGRQGASGFYSFEIGAQTQGGFIVKSEECSLGEARFVVKEGRLVVQPSSVAPPPSDDRLYLVVAAGLPEFRPVFDALATMGFYSINPDAVRALQLPDQGELLKRDGSNMASVLERLQKTQAGEVKKRIEEYLGRVVDGVTGVNAKRVGHMETLEFLQSVEGAKDPWRFPAINMSDGTLRALGILVALFQAAGGRRVPLVGIEEPEIALHPAAAGLLRDCLREGSRNTQVLVTSHSPDLLDDSAIPDTSILAVVAAQGTTQIGTLDEAARSSLRERLYTAGELLRSDQLRPDTSAIPKAAQLKMFGDEDQG